MKYNAQANGRDTEISLEKEGIRFGSRFLDFADVTSLMPINHRVFISTLEGEDIEVSMLGFSYDGFWEEMTGLFGERCQEALFIEEPCVTISEGEYSAPIGNGRGKVALFEDSVCIMPETRNAVRIPLCFTEEIKLQGYEIHFTTVAGEHYIVARMGYDTKPFAERTMDFAGKVKKERKRALESIIIQEPFAVKGLFRTKHSEQYWQAAFGRQCCAVELFTGEDSATYLYRFQESRDAFRGQMEMALEAMGPHREIIYWSQEQIERKPLYRMALRLSPAANFLRERSAGRLIHSESHAKKLQEFLET